MYFTRVCAVCQKKKFEPPCGTFIKGESLFYNKRLSPICVCAQAKLFSLERDAIRKPQERGVQDDAHDLRDREGEPHKLEPPVSESRYAAGSSTTIWRQTELMSA